MHARHTPSPIASVKSTPSTDSSCTVPFGTSEHGNVAECSYLELLQIQHTGTATSKVQFRSYIEASDPTLLMQARVLLQATTRTCSGPTAYSIRSTLRQHSLSRPQHKSYNMASATTLYDFEPKDSASPPSKCPHDSPLRPPIPHPLSS